MIAAVLATLGVFIFAVLAILVCVYVFSGLGLYTLAKNRGIDYAWLAWIPIAQYWLVGDLIDNKVWGFGYANMILVFGLLLVNILGNFDSTSTLSTVLGIVWYVYLAFANFRLYKMYAPDHATLYLVLGVIFPFMNSIWYFVVRNNEPQYIAD